MNTTQLMRQRHEIEQRIDAVAASADPETSTLSADAQAAFDTLWASLEACKQALENSTRADSIKLGREARSIGGDPHFSAFTRSVSISDAIAATMGLQTRGAGAAREASDEIARQRGKTPGGIYLSMGSARANERRVSLTSGAQGTAATGAPLVPTIVRSDLLIDALRSALVLESLGATFLTGLTGNQSVPRTNVGTAVGWFGEDQPIPNTNIAFDSVPLTVKHVGAIQEYSRTMLLNSNADIDALIRNDLMRALAVEIERAALAGAGGGIIPLGILNQPGVQRVVMNDAVTWAGILAMPALVGSANVPMGSPGFVGSSTVTSILMSSPRATALSLGFNMEEIGVLAGRKYVETNQIPAVPATTGATPTPATNTLIFGAWENLLVGVWDALDLSSNGWGEASYAKGSVLVRIIADLDVAVRHPEAFVYCNDLSAPKASQ